jgi:hypothetical protein
MRNEGETEALQAKKANVESRFKRVQTELHAILDANEAITVESKAKVRFPPIFFVNNFIFGGGILGGYRMHVLYS